MTFSQEVKEELGKHINTSRHCQLAQFAAYFINLAEVNENIVFKSDNESLINNIFTLIRKTYNINAVILKPGESKNSDFKLVIDKAEDIEKILSSIKYNLENNNLDKTISSLLIKNSCCKKAFLQGTFLCIGSMSSPDKSYHFELVSSSENQLIQLKEIIQSFGIESRITIRKKSYVLYIKEGEAIVDLLNIMGAHISLMNMENIIILKDMRNKVNRKVNCEAANLIKSVNASNRQIDDIKLLKETHEYEKLPVPLKEMADVRLENPDVPLKDLGNLLDPPVGKSGVNHRLRRLSEIANEIRMK